MKMLKFLKIVFRDILEGSGDHLQHHLLLLIPQAIAPKEPTVIRTAPTIMITRLSLI